MSKSQRVVLVTGGMGGLGETISTKMADAGYKVAVTYSPGNKNHAEWLADMKTRGYEITAVACDVADYDSCSKAVAEVHAKVGPIDVLVNNAAVNPQGSVWSYDPDQFDEVIDVDLNACWYLIRQTVWPMRELGRGSIVNIGSIAAYNGGRGREAPYSAAKAGLHEVTRSVAIEVGPYNIRCNAIAPGLVMSKFVEKHWERFQADRDTTPLRRHAWPEEIANVAAFLISDESSFITGEVVVVSGGSFLRA